MGIWFMAVIVAYGHLNPDLSDSDARDLRVAKAILGETWREFFAWGAPYLLAEAKRRAAAAKTVE